MLNAFVRRCVVVVGLGFLLFARPAVWGADTPIVLTRQGGILVLEPYAPNIVRITLSRRRLRPSQPPGMDSWARRR